MLGVSATSSKKAEAVREADPELFQQIEDGETSVDAAYRAVQRQQAEADQALAEDVLRGTGHASLERVCVPAHAGSLGEVSATRAAPSLRGRRRLSCWQPFSR